MLGMMYAWDALRYPNSRGHLICGQATLVRDGGYCRGWAATAGAAQQELRRAVAPPEVILWPVLSAHNVLSSATRVTCKLHA